MSERIPSLTMPVVPEALHPLRTFLHQLRAMFDRDPTRAGITFGAENGSSVRRVTIQCRDRIPSRDVPGRFLVRVWIGTTADYAPGGTQTVAVVTGTVRQTINSNVSYDIVTDSLGKIVLDVTVAGASTRYVHASVGGEVYVQSAAWV